MTAFLCLFVCLFVFFFFNEGIGCEKDLNLAKQNFLIAAELGHVVAAADFGLLLGESEPC